MKNYKKRWLGLALAIAVAFSTLVPFFALYNHNSIAPVAAVSQKLASIFGEKVLICTGDGFALVSWKDLQAGKTPVKPHKSYLCALCYVASNTLGKWLLLAASALFLWHRKLAGPSLLFLYNRILINASARGASRPRGPPLSFC